ncbi:hypothetical protein ERJ75_000960300 [Trypanosoma vivax]|uniref:Uncharacterized protein n=1 Tax=Trypanosoma vivax (strain Y486) TaxID=1055687 RepID=G0U4V9_TRYVY|nr:hypothetical protein TRVL_03913 [Trypanosoma vivax]KAH8611252.1 hypothetical protein ERJ75_000960300 [Trypanosoma vivax]CCC52474.1 conserved hypothetical protein [Trypanosoma vivax Y486]
MLHRECASKVTSSCCAAQKNRQKPAEHGKQCPYCRLPACSGSRGCGFKSGVICPFTTSESYAEYESGREKVINFAKSALEENLRTQVRLLEHEVRILRAERSNNNQGEHCYRVDIPSEVSNMICDGTKAATCEKNDAPSCSNPQLPATNGASTDLPVMGHPTVALTAPSDAAVQQSSVQDSLLMSRVNVLEGLVSELVAHNEEYRKKIHELSSMIEQMDAVILALQRSQRKVKLPHLVDQASIVGAEVQEELQHRDTPSPNSRQASLLLEAAREARVVHRDGGQTSETFEGASAGEPRSVSRVDLHEVVFTQADPFDETRRLKVQLERAERKVLAWETWYRDAVKRQLATRKDQSMAPQPVYYMQSESQESASSFQHPGGAHSAHPSAIGLRQEKQTRALVQVPDTLPSKSVFYGLDSCQTQHKKAADMLAAETYFLVAREAALREAVSLEMKVIAELVSKFPDTCDAKRTF